MKVEEKFYMIPERCLKSLIKKVGREDNNMQDMVLFDQIQHWKNLGFISELKWDVEIE